MRRAELVDLLASRLPAGTRFGVDGPVQADTAALADEVAARLTAEAVPVARVSLRDFVRARSLRLENGPDDPDTMYRIWYDVSALRRDVLDPFAADPPGDARWLPRLRDAGTDRPFRDPPLPRVPGMVLVLDGRFLLRDDVRGGLDLVAHLDVSPAARRRRVDPEEAARVLPAWQTYLDDARPATRADLTVRFDHPDRPALRR